MEDNPSDVGVEQTLGDTVRVAICVHVAMVSSMFPAPDLDGTLTCSGAKQGEENLQRFASRVGSVRPETMIACYVVSN